MPYHHTQGPQKIRCLLSLLLLLLTLLLTACDADNPTEAINPATIAPTSPSQATQPTQASATNTPTNTIAVTPTFTAIPSPTITGLAQTRDWEYHWLNGIPCKPPCWEGIVPGKTTFDEAVSILKQLPFVDGNTLEAAPYHIIWIGGLIDFNVKLTKPTVLIIDPGISPPVKLADIIKVYGEPEYIAAYRSSIDKRATLHLLWLSQGFMYSSYYPQGSKTPILDANFLFEEGQLGPLFFVPSKLEEIKEWTPLSPNAFVPWEGYKDFYYYCRSKDYTPEYTVCVQP